MRLRDEARFHIRAVDFSDADQLRVSMQRPENPFFASLSCCSFRDEMNQTGAFSNQHKAHDAAPHRPPDRQKGGSQN
jgi:hypothetical protein